MTDQPAPDGLCILTVERFPADLRSQLGLLAAQRSVTEGRRVTIREVVIEAAQRIVAGAVPASRPPPTH
jgi:hypothetical protein